MVLGSEGQGGRADDCVETTRNGVLGMWDGRRGGVFWVGSNTFWVGQVYPPSHYGSGMSSPLIYLTI